MRAPLTRGSSRPTRWRWCSAGLSARSTRCCNSSQGFEQAAAQLAGWPRHRPLAAHHRRCRRGRSVRLQAMTLRMQPVLVQAWLQHCSGLPEPHLPCGQRMCHGVSQWNARQTLHLLRRRTERTVAPGRAAGMWGFKPALHNPGHAGKAWVCALHADVQRCTPAANSTCSPPCPAAFAAGAAAHQRQPIAGAWQGHRERGRLCAAGIPVRCHGASLACRLRNAWRGLSELPLVRFARPRHGTAGAPAVLPPAWAQLNIRPAPRTIRVAQKEHRLLLACVLSS